MICPYCHVPMELEETDYDLLDYSAEDADGNSPVNIETKHWHCVVCDYTDETYDTE